jgi:dTDP-glucose 4,6-dehydratase
MILVTGASGFIGADFVLDWIAATGESVINLDHITYVGNLKNLASLKDDPRHIFVRGDIPSADERKQYESRWASPTASWC